MTDRLLDQTRWAVAGMLCAESQFRRVKGYKQLPKLADALAHTINTRVDDTPVAVTA